MVLGVGRVATAAAGAQRVEADGGEAADRLPVAQRRLSITVHLSQLDVRHFLQKPAYGVFFCYSVSFAVLIIGGHQLTSARLELSD